MKISNLSSLIAITLFTVACNKQPTAAFTTDKTVYEAGETVKLVNKSTNAESYIWTLPNGQVTTPDASFTLDEYQSGNFTFRLSAFSKKDKKVSQAEQQITVNPSSKGAVVFWLSTSSPNSTPMSILLNGVGSQQINEKISGTPDCNNTSCAVFKGLTPGSYNWYSGFMSGVVTIAAGTCLKVKIN
jgi:PKD repeat protein